MTLNDCKFLKGEEKVNQQIENDEELSDDELRTVAGGTGAIINNRCAKCGRAIIPGSGS